MDKQSTLFPDVAVSVQSQAAAVAAEFSVVSLDDVRREAHDSAQYGVLVMENEYEREDRKHEDKYRTWDSLMIVARSYLVGEDVPMGKFIRDHRSAMPAWIKKAVAWCWHNPGKGLRIENNRLHWVFRRRGEYIDFGLPHHDRGGEKYWATRDGKTRVLVNVD